MSPLLAARLALLVAAVGLFWMSIQTGLDTYRFVAIALLVVAVIIRFIDRGRKRE